MSKIPWFKFWAGAACAAVLATTLSLGLWPFHAPRNQVGWLSGRNGIVFGSSGTVLGDRAFTPGPHSGSAASQAAGGHSIEVWAQPHPWLKSGTLFSFYNRQNPSQLRVRDAFNDLALQIRFPESPEREATERLLVPGIFRRGQPVFIAIVCGPGRTAVYLDGQLAGQPPYEIPASAFTGQLILGDSPFQPDSWWGQIMGLAIYTAELSASQAARHYKTWTTQGRPVIADDESADDESNVALYLFSEHSGSVIHNAAHHAGHSASGAGRDAGLDLRIPTRYQVVDKLFMEPFWREFKMTESYWSAVVKNIVGFMPLGLAFHLFLSARGLKRPTLATLILGASVSLTIELLQWLLPTRDSGMTDIFTNTLGTWCGVLLQPYAVRLLIHNGFRSL